MGSNDRSEEEVKGEARRLLKQFLRYAYTLPRVHSEFVRCLICDQLVPITESDPVHDETGEFVGWECETHI